MTGKNNTRVEGVVAVLMSATCFAATSILIKVAYRFDLTPPEVLALQQGMGRSTPDPLRNHIGQWGYIRLW